MKTYTDKEYGQMAWQANKEGKKLVIVTDEEKKPIYNEQGEIIGYETIEVERLEIQDNPDNFKRMFFNTSLGYVRRKPFIKGTGEFKDFLDDILTGLKEGDTILTYTADGTQQIQQVTEQFIKDCREQYTKDFYGENTTD